MQETITRIHGEQNLSLTSGIKVVTDAAYSMKATDHIIWASAADNAVVITLPSKGEAAGGFYCIAAIDVSNDVSVFDKEGASEISDGDLDTVEDVVLLYCTGREWAPVWKSIT